MSPLSIGVLVLRPALCRLGIPLGVGMPDFSIVSLRAIGVTTPLPSLWLPASLSLLSRFDMDKD